MLSSPFEIGGSIIIAFRNAETEAQKIQVI